jgi:hypothetical protein
MKKKAKISQICIFSLFAVVTPIIVWGATQATYYVDPHNGKDNNPGTLSQPFITITRARDVIRTINVRITGDIIVYLRGGSYFISNTIVFNSRDSGTSGHPVIYRNYPGETPVISGGKFITGWTLFDAGKNIYKATISALNFRQLYVNGVKAIRARTPNPGNFFMTTGFDNTNKNIQVESSEISNWNNFTKAEMHLMTQWADNTLRLNSFSSNGQNALVKFQSPDNVIFQRRWPSLENRQYYFFENAYEFIDTVGEWYLNQSTSTLYYKARPGENMQNATVIAPFLETLVKIAGDSLGSPVHHLWFQGITFAHSTYLRPSDSGYLVLQAGQYSLPKTNTIVDDNEEYVGRPAAGIYVAMANNLRFERNIFTQMGATGLDFHFGTHDDVIIGNAVADIAGNGISLAKFTQDGNTGDHVPYNPSDAREICSNDSILNNYVSNISTEIFGACGIACGYPKAVRIEHNEICYCNYSGISVGFGWTSERNAMNDNHIDFNTIHHVIQLLCDGAGIYTLSSQPNSQISNNFIHDFNQSQWAEYGVASIYLDEQTSGFTVKNNVRINVPNIWYSGTYSFNISVNNDNIDSNIIRNAGIEAAYANTYSSTPLILKGEGSMTKINNPSKRLSNSAPSLITDKGHVKFTGFNNPVAFLVMDAMGRTVLQKTLNGIASIDLKDAGLSKGIYIMRASSSGVNTLISKINCIE